MSGILGLFNRNEAPVDPGILGRMMHTLRHRGPDGSHQLMNGYVALGHQSLVTTPEEQASSPATTSRLGPHSIVADARLDNRDELLRALGLSQANPSRFSDTEILLRSYEKWGVECPERLLGAFAFAIWDASRQRFYCARDHFGVKPLYYFVSPAHAIVASEIRPITVHPEVSVRLNEQWIADELAYFSEDRSQTAFQNVHRLAPGHWLACTPGRVTVRKYWSLGSSEEIELGTERAYAEAFREVFMEAVQSRMRRDGPCGSMLSGGLDSSSIACAAQHVADKDALQMHTFSAIFDDVPKSDERTYINEVLEAYSFIPHYIQGDDISPLVLPSLGDNDEKGSDEPIRAPNLHLNWQAYQEADEHEVRIILDGFDGDTTISHGMGSFHEMACNSEWLSLIREARAYANLRDQSAGSIISPMLNRYVFHRIRGYGRLRRWWKTLWNEDTGEESEQQSILAAHFSDRIGWEERKRELSRRPGDPPTTEREFHRRFLTKGDMPRVLETLDRCAAQFQVEVRYPFWDRRLIDFCLSLPRNLKLYQGWSRRIMRIGLDQVLPEKIQWRVDKSDVGHALDHVLYKYSRHQIAQTLNEPVCIDRYADMDVLNRALQRFMAGHPAGQDVLHLWNATTLELWLQRQSNPTP